VRSSSVTITVLLSDDNLMFRTIVRKTLGKHVDLEIVGEATNGREAVDLASRHRPTVCVMDIEMPVISGIEATREICRTLPDTKVLMFSSNTSLSDIEKAVAAGASGFVAKNHPAELPKAIRAIIRHRKFYLGIK
jgi:DNA-binding NarL/FixJ family response regulator